MAGATKQIVFNAPIDRAFEVITNYEQYPQFLTEAKKVRVFDRKGTEANVEWQVDVVKTIKYTVHMKEERPNRVSWTFVNGEFMKDNKGSWVLEAAGDTTKATYTVEMALGPLVPKTIINALVETSLPKMLEAFKKRIEAK